MTDVIELTADERRLLAAVPFNGFCLGSNMWPLIHVKVEPPVDGEVADGLLRRGLMIAEPLPAPVFVEASLNHDLAPDVEVTHRIVLTAQGRRALAEGHR